MRDKTLGYFKKFLETAKRETPIDFSRSVVKMIESLKKYHEVLENGRDKRSSQFVPTSYDQRRGIDTFISSYSKCIQEIEDLFGNYRRRYEALGKFNTCKTFEKKDLEREFFMEADVLFTFFIDMN